MKIIGTLYHHPIETIPDTLQDELFRFLDLIIEILYPSNGQPPAIANTAADFENIYDGIASVLRIVRGEPEPTSTPTRIPSETTAEPI
jgi:hypothetical protein